MDIFKISAVVLVGAMLSVLIKPYRRELAMAVAIAAGLVAAAMTVSQLSEVFSAFSTLADRTGVKTEYIALVLKVTGIAYVSQFAAELCRDSGESALAVKLETAAKISVMVLTLPVLEDFIEGVVGILGGV